MKRKGKKIIGDFFQSTYLFVIFMFLYLPVVVLMVYSFNESKSRGNWGGFSFKWETVNMYILSVVSSMAGGIFGVNIKKKIRK